MIRAMLPTPDWRRTPAGRRAVSFVLAVIIHLLLLLLLLRLAPPVERRPPPGGPTTIFSVPLPPAPQAAKAASHARAAARRAPAAARAPAPRATPPVLPPKTAAAEPWVLNPDLAGFSLAPGKARAPQQVAAADADDGSATSGGASGGGGGSVGRGRSGQPLYAAQWVREPTDAEMSPYLPPGNHVGGWADIACRTVDRFRVEDCEELGQSPPGSGLSRALREASFQFLVRPPRVGGRTLVGEWVRIHFDFVERRRN